MLRKTRITLAALFFVMITLLFLDFTGTLHRWFSWMAKVQALEAVLALNFIVIAALVVLTLVFGRIYCSVICPLGVMQDVFGRLGKKAKKNRYTYSKEVWWLRYPMLVLFVGCLFGGIGTIVQLFAPYSAYGRIATMLLQPVWQIGNNILASFAESMESYAFYSVDVWIKSMPVLVIAGLTAIILFALAWRSGRTYCNTICPVGTVLSLFARFSYLKIHFDTKKCRNCSLCTKNCKASCIDFKNHRVDYSRCVACGDCIESCKFGALTYGCMEVKGNKNEGKESEKEVKGNENDYINASRRSFLLATAMAATTAIAQEKKTVDGGFADLAEKMAPKRQTPLSPPGSLSASNMSQRCTGCQLCVSECPNGVLRPSNDLMNLMQPTMSYERGYCRPECNLCSEVCPAGAIKPIDLDEKSSIQIGHAVWIKKNCVNITDGIDCDNCSRHCPTGAIEMVMLDEDDDESPMVPAVNDEACIGCGACEYVCPARPFPAIFVEGHEVHKTI